MPGAQADHGAPKKLGHEEMLCVTTASEPGLFVTSHLHLCQYQLSSLFFWGADVQTKVRMTCWTLRVSS